MDLLEEDQNVSENSVDFLLQNKFTSLKYERQIKIKKLGRCTPSLKYLAGDVIKKRAFNNDWYIKKKWLTGSSSLNKLFCFPCLLFAYGQGVWSCRGYHDIKHLSEKTSKHENSERHLASAEKLAMFGRMRIDEALDLSRITERNKFNSKVKENREIIKRLIDVTILLAKQELSFRGHREDINSINRGNYIEFLNLLSDYDPILQQHF